MRRILTGLRAGLIAAIITTIINLAGRAAGVLSEAMDLKLMAEFAIDPAAHPAGALALGSVIHIIAGGVVGSIYAFLVRSYTAKSGLFFMLAFWLVMMLVVSPLAQRGLFGIKLGLAFPIATLILHVVFGAVMGSLAQRASRR
jgi:hypothetical protein